MPIIVNEYQPSRAVVGSFTHGLNEVPPSSKLLLAGLIIVGLSLVIATR